MGIYALKGKRVGELQDISRKNLISVIKRIRKERVKVWIGKLKGILQVLWKRVFMDPSKDVCNYYSLCGREDNYGNTIIETVFRDMMRNCLDLIKKETLLQTNACNMVERRYHIIVDRTPKCHPKLASEGIEYYWVCSNNYYRQLSLDEKTGNIFFKEVSKRPYQDKTLPESGFLCFLDVHGNISLLEVPAVLMLMHHKIQHRVGRGYRGGHPSSTPRGGPDLPGLYPKTTVAAPVPSRGVPGGGV